MEIKNLQKLTPRENQILKLLLQGFKTKEIAIQLNLKSNTISTVKRNIFSKLQVKNIIDIIKYFILIQHLVFINF
jgi:DNA-binding NarL/FixJ family response regulator